MFVDAASDHANSQQLERSTGWLDRRGCCTVCQYSCFLSKLAIIACGAVAPNRVGSSGFKCNGSILCPLSCFLYHLSSDLSSIISSLSSNLFPLSSILYPLSSIIYPRFKRGRRAAALVITLLAPISASLTPEESGRIVVHVPGLLESPLCTHAIIQQRSCESGHCVAGPTIVQRKHALNLLRGWAHNACIELPAWQPSCRYVRLTRVARYLRDPNFMWCSTPDCGDALVRGVDEPPRLHCTSCGRHTCFNHERDHPGLSCDEVDAAEEADAQRSSALLAASTVYDYKGVTKDCPQCSATIEKDGGCLHMTCVVCQHEFFWCCLRPYRDPDQAREHRRQCP
jgi:hypothetical protein